MSDPTERIEIDGLRCSLMEHKDTGEMAIALQCSTEWPMIVLDADNAIAFAETLLKCARELREEQKLVEVRREARRRRPVQAS